MKPFITCLYAFIRMQIDSLNSMN